MKLTEDLEGELAHLRDDEKLIILIDGGVDAADRVGAFAERLQGLVGKDRALVFLGIEGAATVPAGARLTDAEYAAVGAAAGFFEPEQEEHWRVLEPLLDAEKKAREEGRAIPTGARLTDAEYDELEQWAQALEQEYGGERGDGTSPTLDALLDAEAKARA